ncbi:MAG: fused MFS/spermidine synthase [Cyanobacteriota/Melainabacteria group bacterium]
MIRSYLLWIGFSLALFLSATMMFVLEPFIAKKLLPDLGGSPNVWNTAVLFFQLILFIGYLYAHLLCTKVKQNLQKFVHLAVLALPLLATSFNLPLSEPTGASPIAWVFISLASMTGALFFALATTAPLLQRWFAQTRAQGSGDPYILYALSNAGSILGLLSYPLWIESHFSLFEQGNIIYWTYAGTALLIALVSFAPAQEESATIVLENTEDSQLSFSHYGRWLLYTSIPASLMLGLTTYVSTELSSLPFFWVVPLLIYLLSFVIAFAKPPAILMRLVNLAAPPLCLLVVYMIFKQVISVDTRGEGMPITEGISLHLVALLVTCLAFHMRLAADRPKANHLTRFYLMVSAGGMIGSSINTFLAPLIFDAWIEYPLVLALAVASLTNLPDRFFSLPSYKSKLPKAIWPVVTMTMLLLVISIKLPIVSSLEPHWRILLPLFSGLAVVLAMAGNTTQLRAGLGVALSFMVLLVYNLEPGTVYRARNFFGCLKISVDRQENLLQFFHGITIHGMESLDPELRGKPVSYFHPRGPIGELTSYLNSKNAPHPQDPVAVVGLGCGTLAAYGKAGQKMVFYEINRDVIDVAGDPLYFTYLYEAKKRGVNTEIIEGDGRLNLAKAPYNYYKLIILDAFNSDSIPTHLLTREALDLYLSKLKPEGVIAFQVTNNYYNLKPLIKALAKSRELPVLYRNDYDIAREKRRYPTEWVVMTRNQITLDKLSELGWKEIGAGKDKIRLWTDDYSNPIKLLITPFS